MSPPSLSSCIVKSLKEREMTSDLPVALLNKNRTEVLKHDETEYWDYKVQLRLDNPFEVAKLAKRVLGFHNSKGGVLIIGVDDDYNAVGIPESNVLDTNVLQAKLRKYVGPNISLFQDSIKVPNNRVLWLVFIPKWQTAPAPVIDNGPQDENGRYAIRRGEYYIRLSDEVKLCVDPGDYIRLFSNVSMDHIQAYLYDIDEPYFRLLAPHCDLFVGRQKVISKVIDALNSRHPVVSLDGVGGVGKSAIAIELVRHFYDTHKYLFIVSLSAKSKVWHEYMGVRKAGFSGLTEFLLEIAKVLQLEYKKLEDLEDVVINGMKDLDGLLLIDNVEDIQDPGVLRFLALKVPEPVKVLVTSRVDKGLGALTVSVTEMEEFEARELLLHELKRVGYDTFYGEESYVDEIIRVTGRLPLALKWAAGIATKSSSLKEASSRLRRQDNTKQEFLNFCFATMFDVLSPLARDVALLCPYLGDEWNVTALSVALDRSESDINRAIDELKDRGIVQASSSTREGALSLLPLTVDFLSYKWHENEKLRNEVTHRLADAIASPEIEGVLLNWPREQRVRVLQQRAEALREGGDLKLAKRLVRLALNWSPFDPRLRFLEGRILYESGKRSDGLSYMHVAIAQASDGQDLAEQRLYLAHALLHTGGSRDVRDALHLFEDAIPTSRILSRQSIDEYSKVARDLREFRSLAKVLDRTENATHMRWIITALAPSLEDPMLIHSCGKSLIRALHISAKGGEATQEERERFHKLASKIEAALNKVKKKDVSHLPDASAIV
jgi:predicted transcriptional regulator